MTQNASSQGTFTQIPNVIYDRCILPAEVIYTFEKLYRQVGHKGGVYAGSYAKLAEQLRTSKNKAFRMVKALESANLLDVDESGSLYLTLNDKDLWILNTLHDNGFSIPLWTDVTATLNSVLKIERNLLGEITNGEEIVLNLKRNVLKIEQVVLILERIGLKIERNVLEIERQKEGIKPPDKLTDGGVSRPPNTINTINTKNNTSKTVRRGANASAPTDQPTTTSSGKKGNGRGKGKKETPPPKPQKLPIVLSPEADKLWGYWCKMPWFRGKPPKLTETVAAHFEDLIEYQPTYESMLACKNWATSGAVDRNGFFKRTAWTPFYLLQQYPRWLSIAPPELLEPPAPAETDQPAPAADKMVYWTRFEHAGTPQNSWFLYERMTEAEARALGGEDYDVLELTPDDNNVISARYKMLEIGEIALPAGVPPDAPAWKHVPMHAA